MDRLKTVKKVFKSGNSYILHLTKELRLLEIEPGDTIEITIQKTE